MSQLLGLLITTLWTFRDSDPYLNFTNIQWKLFFFFFEKKDLFFGTIHKTKARKLRSERHTLTQASCTVIDLSPHKSGLCCLTPKAREPPPPPLPSNPPALPNVQVCGLAERVCLWESRFPWREKCPSRRQTRSVPPHRPPHISHVLCPQSTEAGYTRWCCYLHFYITS